MAEVLVEFDSLFEGPDGKQYEARACARGRDDDLWEGWLEFTPLDGSSAIRTGRETTQPNRDDVMYWASGLTSTYIDGALLRQLQPVPSIRLREVRSTPAYEGPAESAAPVLDPFHVYAEGDDILRSQLNALDASRLRTIVRAYALADDTRLDVATHPELVSLIMTAVEKRAA